MARVYRIGRLSFPYAGRPRDVWRGALTGLILCGMAGAFLSRRWGMGAYGLGGDGGGATVQEMLGPEWPAGVAVGMVVGAILGAFIVFAAGAAWEERGSARGIVIVGTVCGALFAATWGSDLAQRRVVTVRAVREDVTSAPADWKPFFTVSGSGVHLSGVIERKLNVPLLVFLILGGTVVGALAGRGLAGASPAGERFAAPSDGTFQVGPAAPPLANTAAHAPAHAGRVTDMPAQSGDPAARPSNATLAATETVPPPDGVS